MIIVVLCAPRTGSSLTAGLLHHLGVAMGRDLLPADRWNQRGYYEDMQFLNLHRLLTFAHGDPRRQRLLLPAEHPRRRPELLARYRHMIADREARAKPWGVKDPRLAYCLDIFRKSIADPDLRIVAPAREPRAQVESLMALFDWARSDAELVADDYRRRLARALEGWDGPLHRLDYDATLADPGGTVAQLAAFVDREPTVAARACIDPALRRHHYPADAAGAAAPT